MSNTVARRRPGKPGSQKFPKGFYSMQGDDELYELAGNTSIPTATRVQFAAMARGNIWGHAGFAPGELGRIVRIGKNNRTQLNKAISDLKSWGVAAPESTSRCIVLSAALYRRGDRNWTHCQEPSHQERTERMWVLRMGWEPATGFYQAALDDGKGPQIAEKRRVVEEEIEMVTTTTTKTRTRRRVTETIPVPAPRIVAGTPEPECWQEGCTQPIEFGMYCHKHRLEVLARREKALA